jgi:hypothetical protein
MRPASEQELGVAHPPKQHAPRARPALPLDLGRDRRRRTHRSPPEETRPAWGERVVLPALMRRSH